LSKFQFDTTFIWWFNALNLQFWNFKSFQILLNIIKNPTKDSKLQNTIEIKESINSPWKTHQIPPWNLSLSPQISTQKDKTNPTIFFLSNAQHDFNSPSFLFISIDPLKFWLVSSPVFLDFFLYFSLRGKLYRLKLLRSFLSLSLPPLLVTLLFKENLLIPLFIFPHILK
jgi:hypothetical protein